MKKLVFFVFIIILLYLVLSTHGMSQQVSGEQGYKEQIPDEAIRLRILANSDDDQDQDIKLDVRDAVNQSISKWVADIDDIDEARELIQAKLPEIEAIVQSVLKDENAAQSFDVEYGDKVSFPTKVYGNFVYPEGEYEAVLITLGEGEGKNWWCVLFPPLCFLDFSEDKTVAEAAEEDPEESGEPAQEDPGDEDEVDVKFFLWEWLGLS